ncbi:hypothetical protein B0H11DRAFT_452304 [Mycena galericulata]|nr:hypothetical protein B0H11DRAFT_452304 [Mycena galericulata]
MADFAGKYPTPSLQVPPELERQIFEISALSRPRAIPRLMLAAWRVKEWVEPLLYRTIVLKYGPRADHYPAFTVDILLTSIRSKPAFFRDAVRNLLFLVPYQEELKKWFSVTTRELAELQIMRKNTTLGKLVIV